MLKKIIILSLVLFVGSNIGTYGACKIEDLGACKADIGTGINDKLQDKIIPNNIEKMKQPHNTFENRTQLGQPQIPSNINLEPNQEKNTQPYDANCQFGNCFNRNPVGENKN